MTLFSFSHFLSSFTNTSGLSVRLGTCVTFCFCIPHHNKYYVIGTSSITYSIIHYLLCIMDREVLSTNMYFMSI